MKIIIDTAHDGKDEIKRAIKVLYALMDENLQKEEPFNAPQEGLMNMFSSEPSEEDKKEEDEEKEEPQVEVY